jgi:hypothetical protein
MKIFKIIYILFLGLSLKLFTSCIDLNWNSSDDQKPNTLEDGLISFYNFNDNILDQSGNGHNGTAFGGNYIFELGGNKSYTFNGNGEYIKVNNSPLLNSTNAITISLWFKPVDYYGSGFDAIILKPFTNLADPYFQYILGMAGAHPGNSSYSFAFNINVNGVNRGTNSGANTWSAGNWYHVVGMYDGHTMKLYINGVLKSTYNAEGSITVYDTDLFLGRNAYVSPTTPGTLDNVRIYRRALLEKEVIELFQEDFK